MEDRTGIFHAKKYQAYSSVGVPLSFPMLFSHHTFGANIQGFPGASNPDQAPKAEAKGPDIYIACFEEVKVQWVYREACSVWKFLSYPCWLTHMLD